MKRPILIHPDPRLKKMCATLPDVDDRIRKLADDMLETMYDAPGIGLAAPQIGVLDRIIVMDCVKDEDEAPNPMVLINPEIIAASDETNVYEEGCLSIPDQFAEVTRPKQVQVRWMDLNGGEQTQEFDGLWATCVQHEIDHLNGKLFIDYLGAMKRQMITRKMQKLKRDIARGKETLTMAVRPCLPWPDKRLRTPAAEIEQITDAHRDIWQDLIDTMEAMPGVGMGANQIGEMVRLAVVDASEKRGQVVRMANPVILHSSIELRPHEEASPNLPGVSAVIKRPRAVTVEYLNDAGEMETRDFVGLWATSVQHQIDHLNGKMYFDHLSKVKRDMLLRKARKLK